MNIKNVKSRDKASVLGRLKHNISFQNMTYEVLVIRRLKTVRRFCMMKKFIITKRLGRVRYIIICV